MKSKDSVIELIKFFVFCLSFVLIAFAISNKIRSTEYTKPYEKPTMHQPKPIHVFRTPLSKYHIYRINDLCILEQAAYNNIATFNCELVLDRASKPL